LSELKNSDKQTAGPDLTGASPSALEQENLPQVVELPQPENISTPAAVKKAE